MLPVIDTGLKQQRSESALKKQLGNRLRLWRLEKGFLLEDVAGLTGLSVAMVSRVERGERQLRPETKVRIARRLGVRLADLFDVEELAEVVSS
jgi:transcriptional regulator with XRE-family HTH domain